MPVIDHLDYATKRIYLAAGVRQIHPVTDIYREIRELRQNDLTLRGFPMPVTAVGNFAKGGGKFFPRAAVFHGGWRLVPEDVTHRLNVIGEMFTAEGESGPAVIDFDALSTTTKVGIDYEPPTAEIILVQPDVGDLGEAILDLALPATPVPGSVGEKMKRTVTLGQLIALLK